MNILLVTSSPFNSTYGGGEVYVKNQVDELVRQGFLPMIAAPGNTSQQTGSYKGCTIYNFDAPLAQKDFKSLKALLRNIKPGVVHVHGFKAPFALACKELNIPCIVTAHHGGILCPAGTLLNYQDNICRIKANPTDCLPCVLKNIRGGTIVWPVLKTMPLSFRLYMGILVNRLPFIYYITPVLQASLSIQKKAADWKAVYTNATLLIAPSHAIADSMKLNEAPENKIRVVSHGIPLPGPVLLPENKMVNNEKLPVKFFYVGRICHVKGVHVMLAAFSQLTANAELHIIGGAGNKSEERYMQNLKKQYFHNSSIMWHGKIEPLEVSRLIIRFDVLIHPTIFLEVFGLNIAEALAINKPVIATRCGGAEMQIIDGVNGFLVEPNNVFALKQAIEKYLTKPLDISNTPILVKPMENHVKELIKIYEEIIN